MFGFVNIAQDGSLPQPSVDRFRGFYCGLCTALRKTGGALAQGTLTYDLAFLYTLLSSLYEQEETVTYERCAVHPAKPHMVITTPQAGYCADMNLLLAYYKLLDDQSDEPGLKSRAAKAVFAPSAQGALERHREKSAYVADCLHELALLEKENRQEIDLAADCFGRLLGEVFVYQNDMWAPTLRQMGEGLGRYIYFADAYVDLPADLKKGRYNPLAPFANRADLDEFAWDVMTMYMHTCAEAFEKLPIVRDMDILRNIIYRGVFAPYAKKTQPAKGREKGRK